MTRSEDFQANEGPPELQDEPACESESTSHSIPLRVAISLVFEHIERILSDKAERVSFGGPQTQKLLGSLWADDLVVVTGSRGLASGLVRQWCVEASLRSARIHIFTCGESATRLAREMLTMRARVTSSRLGRSPMSSEDFYRLVCVAGDLEKLALTLDETPAPLSREVRTHSGAVHASAEGPLDLIVVDGLELMSTPPDRVHLSRGAGLTTILRDLKRLADEFLCPVLVVWHAAAGNPKRATEASAASETLAAADIVISVKKYRRATIRAHAVSRSAGEGPRSPRPGKQAELLPMVHPDTPVMPPAAQIRIVRHAHGKTGEVPLWREPHGGWFVEAWRPAT